jgi:para-nitrobenzyl esterase
LTTIAETTKGPVQGRIKEDVLLFAGIPYAAPPVGDLRFKAAGPHESWSQVRSAQKFGFAAPQVPSGGLTDSAPVNWNEDCLTLNVSTPALDSKKRPVMVWIHGGGYRTGQGGIPWYNGARFAINGDIVVVSINYRLGALGFTDLSGFGADFATSGVNGTLDQIVALRWVQDNIEAFGGDPDQVTIAGESAGGFSVATLLGSPLAEGLFHRAIPQSGAAHHTLTAAAGRTVAKHFVAAMQADDITALQAASVDQILAAQTQVDTLIQGNPDELNESGGSVSPFYPVVGNDVLPRSPLEAISDGTGADIPVLTGTNRDETTLWGYGRVDEDRLRKTAAGFGAGDSLLAAFRKEQPEASPDDLMIAMTTDHSFRIPAIRLAEARAKHEAQTWMYLFCWESRAMEGRLKATHSLEIPFAFDNLHQAGVEFFLGEGDIPQHVADVMHKAWIDFIRDGGRCTNPSRE